MTRITHLSAQELIDQGYYQVSRKYGHLAKLPPGKTGIQALIDSCRGPDGKRKDGSTPIEFESWAKRMGEGHAGDQYLRCYAADDETVEVIKEVMDEFRKLGGTTYLEKHWTDGVIATGRGCPIDGTILVITGKEGEAKFRCADGHTVVVTRET